MKIRIFKLKDKKKLRFRNFNRNLIIFNKKNQCYRNNLLEMKRN